jgi:hypothetical protein
MRRVKSTSTLLYRASRARELGRHSPRGLTGIPWLALLTTSICVALPAVAGAVLPASASAALPDGRVYEQVSPANKNGNVVNNPWTQEAGVSGSFGLAAEDGDSVVFVGSGAMGASYSGLPNEFVARRSSGIGWTTNSAIPRLLNSVGIITTESPNVLVPSSDFSRFLFGALASYVSAEPFNEGSSSNIFLSEDPAVEPTWVAQPTIPNPIPAPGHNQPNHDYLITGATPSLSTVYFTYSGTLIAQDASRAPYVGAGMGVGDNTDPWGFYEWSGGALSEAGVLPDGTLDPFGAVPAAIAGDGVFPSHRGEDGGENQQAQELDNEVSIDGSRAFFMSPDPVASTVTNQAGCEHAGPGQCTSAPPELYVRETAPDGTKSSVLVSRSQLPGHVGEPAPDGLVSVENAPIDRGGGHAGASYVYSSPDGSQAFFVSADQLTAVAPDDGSAKEYDFNVNTGTLTYLPGVAGPIVASSNDGSDFIFEHTATTSSEPELDLWSAGSGGGHVTSIAPLPAPANVGELFEGAVDVSAGRASADGSVFVFRTNSPLPGAFNNAGGFAQVYRYDLATGLSCVSCPPVGVAPSGDARVSYDNASSAEGRTNGTTDEPMSTLDTRVMSSDGSRVFFDTPDPLVPQATNGKRNVYEWENGHVYLISSGKSVDNSYVLDSSADGGDVFFTTAEGLVPGDTDGSYDVYDARIPRPGDNPPATAVPCEGSVCQGPPNVPSPLTPPVSATFSGLGNLTAPAAKPPVVKPRPKAKGCKQGFTKKKNKCIKNEKAKRAKKSGRDRRAK